MERAPQRGGRLHRLTVMVIVLLWASQLRGLVSSNDGSHVALARAFAHGRTELAADAMLTLLVDHAQVADRHYSDQPPGTAFAALPAVWLGQALDRPLFERSVARMGRHSSPAEIREALVFEPAAEPYLATYGQRRHQYEGASLNLVALQGTALLVGIQGMVMGLLGLLLVDRALRHLQVTPRARAFVAVALGLGSLWGPYSTVLYRHVTAGALLFACAYALARLAAGSSRWLGLAAGACGAWAVACDYALAVAVVPMVALCARPRDWPWIALGALPPALATLAYHQAAFGSPWITGHHHHADLAFGLERQAAFSRRPLRGVWNLYLFGRNAGLLSQSSVLFIGGIALAASPRRRWLLALLPWMVLLCFHPTPWGGPTFDYRYLIPALPFFAVGLGWSTLCLEKLPPRAKAMAWWALGLATVASIAFTWTSFASWRDDPPYM